MREQAGPGQVGPDNASPSSSCASGQIFTWKLGQHSRLSIAPGARLELAGGSIMPRADRGGRSCFEGVPSLPALVAVVDVELGFILPPLLFYFFHFGGPHLRAYVLTSK